MQNTTPNNSILKRVGERAKESQFKPAMLGMSQVILSIMTFIVFLYVVMVIIRALAGIV